MNEWYAKDTSNKIKAVFRSRMQDGKRCSGSVPYGYKRHPDDKQTLYVDEEAAEVVRKIFQMAGQGIPVSQIAQTLREEKVLIPSAYYEKNEPGRSKCTTILDPCNWTNTTVGHILARQEYLGHTVLGKSTRESFKSKRRKITPPEELLIFKDTHEPIITQEQWDLVQIHRKRGPTRQANGQISHRLSGLIYCADCGGRMGHSLQKNKDTAYSYWQCGNYRGNHGCSSHYVRYHPIRDYLEQLEWDGVERIRNCLHHFLGADTDDYTYEALKLFLLGAISRVHEPGCKFEYMLCLVGGQGAGKSTFFRFLAIKDEWFSDDLKQLGGDTIYEKLQGHWIIEMSEMLATANAKSIEEIKSFLSRQRENYRIPYDKFPADRPRQCVFGGTSNNMDFLPLDRSGNRRFLPVQVHPELAEVHILDDEQASRAYIDQVWAEAIAIYRSGDFRLHFSPEMEEYLKIHQQDFMPEDTKAIRIQNYLDSCKEDKVCALLLHREALGRFEEPKGWELKEIRSIMRHSITGWQEFSNPRHFGEYGRQRGWERIPADTQAQHMEQFSIIEPDAGDDLPDAW